MATVATDLSPRRDPLLVDLDESQEHAVTMEASPLAILAGPGSGKTRVLTRRIAWQAGAGNIAAEHVLALTFTRKAAGELGVRLARLGVARAVTAGTIHAISLAQLRRRSADWNRTMPGLLERKARLIVPMVGGRGAEVRLAAADVASEIEWAKARLLSPDQYEAAASLAGREPSRTHAEIAVLYERYEKEKRRRRLVDFDDLLWWCAEALESDAEFAAAQRWRFRHLFVDEFQDVSPAQVRLLRAWLGDRPDLCVVGDPDQAIYSFTGADPVFLTRFARHFAGGQVVRLECNYRSTPEVVGAATALLADGGGSTRPKRAMRASGPAPVVTTCNDEDDEARVVADRLRDAHSEGVAWSELAVLYRTNAQSAAFEEALTKVAIPFRVRGTGRFLERPEVEAALERLRRGEKTAPGRDFAAAIADLEAHGDDVGDEQREHVDALARLAREYIAVEGGTGSVSGFVAYLTATMRGETADVEGDGVELLTFHRAKGLEFHTVFVTGLERGLVPISHADTPAERAEERRLLYVALTRAEQVLHLTYATQRTLGSKTVSRARSPWLQPIEDAFAPAGTATSPRENSKEQVAKARRQLAPSAADSDDPLLSALVEWRRNLARASAVPAYIIFNDETLREVASTKPTSPEALLMVGGIGPVKAQRHGDAVLDLVRRHAG